MVESKNLSCRMFVRARCHSVQNHVHKQHIQSLMLAQIFTTCSLMFGKKKVDKVKKKFHFSALRSSTQFSIYVQS